MIDTHAAVRAIAGSVMVFVALVSTTSVVGASSVPLDTGATSGLVPEVPTDGDQPCAPDETTVPPTTSIAPTTAPEPAIDTATEIAPATPIELVIDTATDPAPEATPENVEPCDTTSTDPSEPLPTTVPPSPPTTLPPPPPPTIPAEASTPSPEVAAIPPSATVAEVPPLPAGSGDTSIPLDPSVGVVDPVSDISPTAPAPAVTAPVAPPPIPAVNSTWTTGVTRSGAPREPGPSALRPGRTPEGQRVVLADQIEVILATIRQLESGGRYDVGPNKAKASGAYQYIPSTWRNEGGYPDAYLAPPEVQDARARADVERFLAMYGGDVSMVPVMWYYPRAASDARWMDRVPNPAGGNRLTIREYQARWMELLARNSQDLLGAYVPAPTTPAAVSVLTALPDVAADTGLEYPLVGLTAAAAAPAVVVDDGVEAVDGVEAPLFTVDAVTVSERTMQSAARSVPPEVSGEHGAGSMRAIVFPVLGPVVYADGWGDVRDGGLRRHEGTDIIGVPMQPLLAATDGQITQLRLEAHGRSGVAMSIRDADGWRYNYFHANNDTPGTDDGAAPDGFRLAPGLQVGDDVIAGQIIGYLGDSGNAEDSVAHLHFEFRDPRGRAAPSFWSLQAAEARQACTVGIGPWSTPTLSPDVEPDTLDTDSVASVEAATGEAATGEAERPVWHTVVTPLYGEGQWVIDSDGRVTATGDAALVIPSRTLECAPGPATPFGTDAGGWARYDHDALTGTVLDGADLTGTVLDGTDLTGTVLDEADLAGIGLDPLHGEWSLLHAHVHVPLPDAMVFTDPASGERIIVTLGPPPNEPTPPPTSADRAAGSPAALGPAGRREPRRAGRLEAKTRRTTGPLRVRSTNR